MEEALLLFLKWPEPGRAKTRLVPAVGEEGAARISRELAELAIGVVRSLRRPGLVRRAFFDPPDREVDFRVWVGPDLELLAQPAGDLGARLLAGFDAAFAAGARRVVAVGSDCPEMAVDHLGRAFDALTGSDAVVGPATDGGYWLIGLARPCPGAFTEVPWSTGDTLTVTRRRLAEAGFRVAELETLADVDRPEDLSRLHRPAGLS